MTTGAARSGPDQLPSSPRRCVQTLSRPRRFPLAETSSGLVEPPPSASPGPPREARGQRSRGADHPPPRRPIPSQAARQQAFWTDHHRGEKPKLSFFYLDQIQRRRKQPSFRWKTQLLFF